MSTVRVIVVLGFVLLIGVPLVFRPTAEQMPETARRLIIVTPHNEQIRYEFARAFNAWHKKHHGEAVNVIYNVPGGTSEIRRMLQAQFEAALEQNREPGGNADLVFGGGSYEHSKLKEGVTVTVNGETRATSISQPVTFSDAYLNKIYGANQIGNTHLYDSDRYWFGTALSGFGIVYNRDVLRELNMDEPTLWRDLCDRRLRGWVALVNPAQSGSVTTAFEAILHRRGWATGWRIMRRAGANARYFSASSLRPPSDVSQGNAAMGVCIDFYGRYQSQAIIDAGGGRRVGYVDPPKASTIDPDPISMLKNPLHPELARRFIRFCLSEQGQALWQFHRQSANTAQEADMLGPEKFELRRMPVRRMMYDKYIDRMIDQVNPFEIAAPMEEPNRAVRSYIAIVFGAMTMDAHESLQAAWNAIVEHPAYPDDRDLVTAADVTDPTLRRMLELFDAMPDVPGPDGQTFSLDSAEALQTIKAGWLRGGWAEVGLWPDPASPDDVLRRRFARFFRSKYESIVELAEENTVRDGVGE